MRRDFDRLRDATFDVLVVGGGIHGLFTAGEASARGLSVALVEKDDYGSGLTFNHQRTIHGGLRALETLNIRKAAAQIAERRQWATMAPAHLRPLPFVVPVARGDRPSLLSLRAGLQIYDWIGAGRNRGLPPGLHLPASRVLSASAVADLFPGLPHTTLVGGALWADYQTIFPDRLTWLVALAARRAGAVLVNHAAAIEGLRTGSAVAGARVCDELTGQTIEVRARATVLSGGPGLGDLYARFGLDDTPPPLVAVANILVNRPARRTALARRGPEGRRLTAVPWGGYTLIGTFQSQAAAQPGAPSPLSMTSMLAEANATFPGFSLTSSDVRLVHRGLVPGQSDGRTVDLLPDSALVHHAARGVAGVLSIVGTKFTTARLVAAEAVDAVAAALTHQPAAAAPRPAVLPFAACAEVPDALGTHARSLGLDEESIAHLSAWYGSEASDVLSFSQREGLTTRLSPKSPVLAGEIAYAVEHADACRLADAVLRRTWLGATGEPDAEALDCAAAVAAPRLGWSPEQRASEIRRVKERFTLTAAP